MRLDYALTIYTIPRFKSEHHHNWEGQCDDFKRNRDSELWPLITLASQVLLPMRNEMTIFMIHKQFLIRSNSQIVLPVLKPLGERSSAAMRKFPAAALMRMSSLPSCSTTLFTTRTASSFLRTSPSIPMACHIHHANNLKVFRFLPVAHPVPSFGNAQGQVTPKTHRMQTGLLIHSDKTFWGNWQGVWAATLSTEAFFKSPSIPVAYHIHHTLPGRDKNYFLCSICASD